MRTTKEILQYAAQRIAKGHTKGAFGPYDKPEGPVCALGAIRAACLGDPDYPPMGGYGRGWSQTETYFNAVRALAATLPRTWALGDSASRRVYLYNDDPLTTADDVFARFTEAICSLDNAEPETQVPVVPEPDKNELNFEFESD